MIPFIVVKTKRASPIVRPEHVVAINAADPADCTMLMTDGVTIAAAEPAEDIVARLEAEAREEDEAADAQGAQPPWPCPNAEIETMIRDGLPGRPRRGEGPGGRRQPLRRDRRLRRLQGREQGASSTRWSTPRSRARWAGNCTRWR